MNTLVAVLKRVQVNLKRYRTNVLQLACDGKLLRSEEESALTEGREYETASKFLDCIQTKRRTAKNLFEIS